MGDRIHSRQRGVSDAVWFGTVREGLSARTGRDCWTGPKSCERAAQKLLTRRATAKACGGIGGAHATLAPALGVRAHREFLEDAETQWRGRVSGFDGSAPYEFLAERDWPIAKINRADK